MESPIHPLSALFDQLGLPSDHAAIEAFIGQHAPLDNHTRLAEAPFWTSAQQEFLSAELDDDADWAEVIDSLDARLRSS